MRPSCSQASGTIMSMAWGRALPARHSSSSALSRLHESLPSGAIAGKSSESSPNLSDASAASLAFMANRLPLTVLISPVVAQKPERLGQGPGGKRIGAVALVDNGHGAFHVRIGQVGIVLRELPGQKHALVHQGLGRQARHMENILVRQGGTIHRVFDFFTDREQLSLQVLAFQMPLLRGDEILKNAGFSLASKIS